MAELLSPARSGSAKVRGGRDDVELAYETFGNPENQAVLLISGNGQQLVGWHKESLVAPLVRSGYYVVRFDNRDHGLSSRLPSYRQASSSFNMLLVSYLNGFIKWAVLPSAITCLLSSAFRQWRRSYVGQAIALIISAGLFAAISQKLMLSHPDIYSLDDMAEDTKGLLDHLGISKCHIVGASMGGMVAQLMSIQYPELVKTMTCISSAPDAFMRGPKGPSWSFQLKFLRSKFWPQADVEDRVKTRLFLAKHSSPAYNFEEQEARENIAEELNRCRDRSGVERQQAAIYMSWDRRPALRKLRIPTLVMHGTHDAMIPVDNGRDVAEVIPGARLVTIKHAGHYIDSRLSGRVFSELLNFFNAIERP